MPLSFPLMPTLYLVPTPLGDPDDITLRALRILREASAIASNNFHATRLLLDAHSISTPMIDDAAVLDALNNSDVALVSSAGTPGMGDVAQEIVREAIVRGIRVEPLPGADAAITALVLSGLPTEAFVSIGALPDDLTSYAHERETMIFAVSAASLLPTLCEMFGDRRICIVRGEQALFRGMLSDALRVDYEQPYMLVVAGAEPEVEIAWDEARVRAALRAKLDAGEPLKLAAKAVAAVAGWDRRAVYALGVEMKN